MLLKAAAILNTSEVINSVFAAERAEESFASSVTVNCNVLARIESQSKSNSTIF